MNKSEQGAAAELKACAWLIESGYDVFRNVSPTGCIDLIARCQETGRIRLIDVKSFTGQCFTPDGRLYSGHGTDKQRELGVEFVLVSPDEDIEFVELGEPMRTAKCLGKPGHVDVTIEGV